MNDDTGSPNAARCSHCSLPIAPQSTQCPNCGAVITGRKPSPSTFQRLASWRHFRHLLIALILFLLPHVPFSNKIFPYKPLFPTSSLVGEAITRANSHPGTDNLVGSPVSAGWLSHGYVHSDETGWSEGKMWIPITGAKASGMLHALGGQADTPWVFSELRLVRDDGQSVDLLEPTASTSLTSLPKHARIYIVPLGDVQGLGLDELPEFYRKQYDLSVEVLRPIPLEDRTRNQARGQLIFEELVALMHRRLPRLASDPSAFLIGVTDEDMYIRKNNWNFAYTAYGDRAGAVSSHRFVPDSLVKNERLLRSRVRKMISRTIGFVVFKLPPSDDPSSVMYRDLYGSTSADLMSDRFEGLGARAVVDEFKTAHGLASQPGEILPQMANFDYSKVDGRYPCLLIRAAKDTAPRSVLTQCEQGVSLGENLSEIEVDLRGNLVTRNSDIFLPGNPPLSVTRCYRAWESLSRTYGQNTALSWDLFPIGSRQPYTYIEIIPCDGNTLRYERISKGTGYADAVYEHRATNTPFLGSRISWNGSGWDLKLRDGSLYLFPESYYAKKSIDGALSQIRYTSGVVVKMVRGEGRNLKKLVASDGRAITFEHDASGRVITAASQHNQKATYLYDPGGRLAEVRTSNATTRYSYENTYLRSVEVNGRSFANITYEWGRVSGITLPTDGTHRFRYEYDSPEKNRVLRTLVTSPDGTARTIEIPPY